LINILSEEQKEKFIEYREKWINIGLSIEPANRKIAERAINELYILADIEKPKKIVWCGSPFSQELVRTIILDKNRLHSVSASVSASVMASVRSSVWDSVNSSVWASVWASVSASVREAVRSSVRDSVNSSVRDSVRDSVNSSVWDSVRDSVMDSVSASVWEDVREGVNSYVWSSVRASVGDSVSASVRKAVRSSVRDSVSASVRSSVRDSVRDSVSASVWEDVREGVNSYVWSSVRASVGDSVWDSVWDSASESAYGQHDADWLAFYEYFREVVGLKKQTEKLVGLIDLAKSAGGASPHKNICLVSERHCVLNRDEHGRLHSIEDAACMYPDGWAIYAIHGVRIPEYVVKFPEKITIELIEIEENSEIKRVMIDQYDRDFIGRYLQDSGAKLIDVDIDQYGRPLELYIKYLKNDEAIVMVKVQNSSLEPDGSRKNYFLRVPPHINKAKEAVAWTFEETIQTYKPAIET